MKRRIRLLIKQLKVTTLVYAPTLADTRTTLVALYRRIFRDPLEPAFLALQLIGVSNKRVLLDVGGGWGQSVAALRFYAKNAPIVSFEPNSFFSVRIKRRFARDANVEVRQVALGNGDGAFPLYIPIYRYTAYPDLATLIRTEAENWLPPRILGFRQELQTILEMTCTLMPLDALNLDPEILKIDTRCDASSIIEGASKTIMQSRPLLILEKATLSDRSLKILEDAHYTLFIVANRRFKRADRGSPCDVAVHSGILEKLHSHVDFD